MRPVLAIIAAASLAACAMRETPISRPAEGYKAFRVTQTMYFPYGLGGLLLPAGRVYVADRQAAGSDKLLWCTDQQDAPCLDWDGKSVTLQPQTALPVGPFPIPPGAVEEFRLR